MDIVMVYVNTGSEAEARTIGRALVESGLAAAANVIPGLTSYYRWDGELREVREATVVAKTRAALLDRVTDKVTSLHAYERPAILAVEVAAGEPAYLDWIRSETA